MQTRALATLLEISRQGSFATAAEHLNMTLSAVSMQMKSLEAQLGVTLFDRSFRPPKLTSLGRSVCAHGENMLAAERDLLTACVPNDQLVGNFKIGFVPTASVRLLPEFLIRAKELAPDARFNIETGLSEVLEARVLAGHLDAAVITSSANLHSRLTARSLRLERLAYAAPQSMQAHDATALFGTMPFFQFLPQSGVGEIIAAHVRTHIRDKRSTIVLDSVEAIMECVNMGIGFTLLPEPDILRYATKDVCLLPDGAQPIFRELVLAVAQKGSTANRIDQIAALFGNTGGD